MTCFEDSLHFYQKNITETYRTANRPLSLLLGLFNNSNDIDDESDSSPEQGIEAMLKGVSGVAIALGVLGAPFLLTAEVVTMTIATLCIVLPMTLFLPFQLLYAACKDCATASSQDASASPILAQ